MIRISGWRSLYVAALMAFFPVLGCLSHTAVQQTRTATPPSGRPRATEAYGRKDYGLLRSLALQGDQEAEFILARLYETGEHEQKNLPEAALWYLKGAEQGHVGAQYHLGVMYMKGDGIPQDFQKAAAWLLKAGLQGSADAANNLALLYRNGWGVDLDYTQVSHWFLQAAKAGVAQSQYGLGVCLKNGLGVNQDFVQAYAWFRLASAGGYQDPSNNLAYLEIRMTSPEISKAEALAAEWKKSYDRTK